MKKYLMIIVLLLPLICQGQIIITKPMGPMQIGIGYTYNCNYLCNYAKVRIGHRGPIRDKLIESKISCGSLYKSSIGGIGAGIGLIRYNKQYDENPIHYIHRINPVFLEFCIMRNVTPRLSVLAITDVINWETEIGVKIKL